MKEGLVTFPNNASDLLKMRMRAPDYLRKENEIRWMLISFKKEIRRIIC